ncbi:hypothetical protein G5C60_16975 [Streptomyces sp. HC44]|uniref:Uncharacterized protein n=1 Tax=Streptomyces scabichelini TaxID=2711217 RepID=A0A6G4V5F1_9ACTN|nr:hypothetical protein [Streptomyces scabichelini]NGO09246.1 hypothetical protein [Streptomyces scabichelini]
MGRLYADPVDGLVHAAVADRPLDEVIQLIKLLEQSPEYAAATADALRAVGTDRSVEDVSRLVALLTQPPRNADSADEAIRAAAEGRPVEDVTRLMALLHRSPLEPHCAQEAVRAVATSRPVEELVQLIGRLAQERGVRAERQRAQDSLVQAADGSSTEAPEDGPAVPLGTVGREVRAKPDGTAKDSASPAWRRRLAASALLLCGLAYFPPDRSGASANAYGFAMGASVLCVLLALALFRKRPLPVLAAGVLLTSALAMAQLLEGRLRSPGLTRAVDITAAPPWLAGLTAVLAALASLTALLTLLSSDKTERHPEPRRSADPDRAASASGTAERTWHP